jgi:hypothetical protein
MSQGRIKNVVMKWFINLNITIELKRLPI